MKNKNWDSIFSVSLTDEHEIPINKRGSGVRRLILLSFFRAKAEIDSADLQSRGIIYGIEEPETSQHPNNQKLLLETLEDLVSNRKCQVILTTHTPVLVKTVEQKNIRFISQIENRPIVEVCTDDNSLEISRSLGIIPDHSVKCFVGVEGKHDISFLKELCANISTEDPSIPNLLELENGGKLVFIPLGGSNLELWISRLNSLNRPQFYLMDRDIPPPKNGKYHEFHEKFKAEGHESLMTTRKELENYIHVGLLKKHYPSYTGTGDEFEDVPLLIAQAIHLSSEASDTWENVLLNKDKMKHKISNAKKSLNTKIVKEMNLSQFQEIKHSEELLAWLRKIKETCSS